MPLEIKVEQEEDGAIVCAVDGAECRAFVGFDFARPVGYLWWRCRSCGRCSRALPIPASLLPGLEASASRVLASGRSGPVTASED